MASVLSGMPGEGAPEAVAVEVPAGSEFAQSREDQAAEVPAMNETPQPAGAAPVAETPAPDDLDPLAGADTQPAARPATGMAEGDLSAPQVAAGADAAGTEEQSPALQAAPPVPKTEGGEASISADPDQPAPPAADEGAVFARPPATDEAPAAALAPESDLPEAEPEAPEIATAPEPGSGSEPEPASGTIGNMAEGVATNRLPKVTDVPAEAVEEAAPARVPAIVDNAVPFDNAEAKPLMAIVLIDDGTSPIGLEALHDFPYPLSFAVDPAWSGAAEAAERYREAGFEVLAMADLPPGAQPVDTETVMQTVLATVPDAVAILEGTGDGLQSGREAAEQLAPILLESGHGLVMFPKGLDTAQKLIAREGVPSATVFRDFDAKGQNETVIRRFLDQAAFKASREEGGVIMLGRLRADTITALILWGLQDRANRVALAPVSAVLTGK